MQSLVAFNNGEQSKPFRDKVAKTMQYLAKLLTELVKDEQAKKSFALMATNISMARRIYRWGQVSGSIELIIKLFQNKSISTPTFLKKLVLLLSYFFSQSFDMLCYIYLVRFQKNTADRASYWSQFFYFITCCIEFYDVLGPLFGHISKLVQLSVDSTGGEEVEKEKARVWNQVVTGLLNGVRRIGDGVTAIRDVLPEIFEPYKLTVAASGFTSGAVAIYQAVPALYGQK